MTIPEFPAALPTRQQRQILRLLAHGDLLWERAEDAAYCTVYHEKRGRDQLVSAALVTTLVEQGWVYKRPNPQPDRLDSWEITPAGRALLAPRKGRRSGEPSARMPPGTSIGSVHSLGSQLSWLSISSLAINSAT